MTTINVLGYDFEINMNQKFCKQGAKKAKALEKTLKAIEITPETDLSKLGDKAVELVEACKTFVFWVFGREKVIETLGKEITIAKLVNFSKETCYKLSEIMPKEDVMTKKIKL